MCSYRLLEREALNGRYFQLPRLEQRQHVLQVSTIPQYSGPLRHNVLASWDKARGRSCDPDEAPARLEHFV